MIVTLHGEVAEKLSEHVVIECAGVGYGILVTNEDYGRLAVGQRHRVYVYEHIREQQYDLFGFVTLDTKRLFQQLLDDVNGVGPKTALNILSIGSASDVRAAIATGDLKFIQQASGVGKRVAERVVIELKDKVGLEGVSIDSLGVLHADGLLLKDDAVQALVSLGYSPQDAALALQHVDASLPVEDRIKQALSSPR
jgi:holliday junction DNA helicase RuvA